MTHTTEQLREKIDALKQKNVRVVRAGSETVGYSMSLTIITDLLGCVVVGYAVGFMLQNFFGTPPLLTAGLTLLGGVAGLYTVVRYAVQQDKRRKKR